MFWINLMPTFVSYPSAKDEFITRAWILIKHNASSLI